MDTTLADVFAIDTAPEDNWPASSVSLGMSGADQLYFGTQFDGWTCSPELNFALCGAPSRFLCKFRTGAMISASVTAC